MGFHQSGESQVLADGKILFELCIVQNRADEQHRRSAQKLCFVDHVRIHGKILAQAGCGDSRSDLLQIGVTAQKPLWLGQHRDGICPGGFVFSGDLQVRELRCDEPLGGRCFFTLTDKGKPRLCKGFFKPEVPFGQGQRLPLYFGQRQGLLCRFHPLPGVFGQLV